MAIPIFRTYGLSTYEPRQATFNLRLRFRFHPSGRPRLNGWAARFLSRDRSKVDNVTTRYRSHPGSQPHCRAFRSAESSPCRFTRGRTPRKCGSRIWQSGRYRKCPGDTNESRAEVSRLHVRALPDARRNRTRTQALSRMDRTSAMCWLHCAWGAQAPLQRLFNRMAGERCEWSCQRVRRASPAPLTGRAISADDSDEPAVGVLTLHARRACLVEEQGFRSFYIE